MNLRVIFILSFALIINSYGASSPKNSDCLECHSDKTLCKTNSDGREVSLFVDEVFLKNSVHQTNTCFSCHSDITNKHPDDEVPAKPVDCGKCHNQRLASYKESIHGILKEKGEMSVPNCSDCHGTHKILSPANPESSLHFSNLSKTCGECHTDAMKDLDASVHGKTLAKGHREAATCIDCHSEHKITKLKGASPIQISENVCAKCHSSEKINTKFNIPSDKVKTFLDSYHGLASHLGSVKVANCASCHGYHKILPSTNPESSIYKTNLVATCGKCHPGASDKFASGRIHTDVTQAREFGEKLNYIVRKIYLALIVLTIGGFFLHNFLIWLNKAVASFRNPERKIERLTKQMRLQHIILMVSFIYLAISGFALKFPDSWLSLLLGNSEGFRRISHRVAGVILIGLGMYHIIYVFAMQEGKRLLKDMLPKWKDVKDVFATIKYAFNKGEKPITERFSYVEKIEYWAVIWGTIIMGVTGFVVWFKIAVTDFLPRWVVDVSLTIHYYEAILACSAIVIWHFYHVIFDPDVYPMNWAWFDGKVSEKQHHEKQEILPVISTQELESDDEDEDDLINAK